jgi:NADH-quinone oxidoreductase subunit J
MSATEIVFLFFAAIILSGAWIVVTARNLIHAALCMALCFFGVAGLFALLEAPFLAVVALVIGAGGISILIIFAIMLTRGAGMGDAPLTNRWPLALAISMVFFGVLAATLFRVPWPNTAAPITRDSVAALGVALLDPNQYLLSFEIAGVLLLTALIGSVFVASGKK